jgi:hypothetical protein
MPNARVFLAFLLFAAGCACVFLIAKYMANAITKKAKAKVEIEHDFEDKVADLEIEKLKRDKTTELKKAKKKILGDK